MEISLIPIKNNQITQQGTGVKEKAGTTSFIDMLLGQMSAPGEAVPEETPEHLHELPQILDDPANLDPVTVSAAQDQNGLGPNTGVSKKSQNEMVQVAEDFTNKEIDLDQVTEEFSKFGRIIEEPSPNQSGSGRITEENGSGRNLGETFNHRNRNDQATEGMGSNLKWSSQTPEEVPNFRNENGKATEEMTSIRNKPVQVIEEALNHDQNQVVQNSGGMADNHDRPVGTVEEVLNNNQNRAVPNPEEISGNNDRPIRTLEQPFNDQNGMFLNSEELADNHDRTVRTLEEAPIDQNRISQNLEEIFYNQDEFRQFMESPFYNQIEPGQLADEDWVELDHLLSTLLTFQKNLGELQINKGTEGSIQTFFEKQNLSSLQNPLKETSMEFIEQASMKSIEGLDQEHFTAAVKDLQQWLFGIKGSTQNGYLNTEQIQKALTQLASMQSADETPIPDSTKAKIKILLDAFDAEIQGTRNESKQILSLDKNQVGFYTKPFHETSVNHNKIINGTETEGNETGLKFGEQMKVDQAMIPTVTTNHSQSSSEIPKVNAGEFAQHTSEWVKGQLQMPNGKMGATQARFLLNPEHLGAVEIKISFEQGQVTTQILAETIQAKEVLEGQLQQLKQGLQQQGLIVQRLEVALQQITTTESSQSNLMSSGEGSRFSQEQQHSQASQTDRNLANSQNDNEQQENGVLEQAAFTYGANSSPVKGASQIDFTA